MRIMAQTQWRSIARAIMPAWREMIPAIAYQNGAMHMLGCVMRIAMLAVIAFLCVSCSESVDGGASSEAATVEEHSAWSIEHARRCEIPLYAAKEKRVTDGAHGPDGCWIAFGNRAEYDSGECSLYVYSNGAVRRTVLDWCAASPRIVAIDENSMHVFSRDGSDCRVYDIATLQSVERATPAAWAWNCSWMGAASVVLDEVDPVSRNYIGSCVIGHASDSFWRIPQSEHGLEYAYGVKHGGYVILDGPGHMYQSTIQVWRLDDPPHATLVFSRDQNGGGLKYEHVAVHGDRLAYPIAAGLWEVASLDSGDISYQFGRVRSEEEREEMTRGREFVYPIKDNGHQASTECIFGLVREIDGLHAVKWDLQSGKEIGRSKVGRSVICDTSFPIHGQPFEHDGDWYALLLESRDRDANTATYCPVRIDDLTIGESCVLPYGVVVISGENIVVVGHEHIYEYSQEAIVDHGFRERIGE
jgi:hypothetical protein